MQDLVQEMVTFAVVCQEGSLTAAAKRLRKSKGYVSTHLVRLEEHIGTKLLYRSTRKIALTQAGSAFLPHCESLLKSVLLAQTSLEDSHEQLYGEVRLTVPMSFGLQGMQSWVAEFHQRYPDIVLRMDLSNIAADLESDQFDLAIRATNDVSNQDYVAVHLTSFRYGLYASKAYLEQNGVPKTLSSLTQHQAVLHSEVDHQQAWRLMDGGMEVQINPRPVLFVNSASAACKGAEAGLGIARLPQYLIHGTELIPVLPEHLSAPIAVQLVYAYQGQQPKRVRALIDFLKQKRDLGEAFF